MLPWGLVVDHSTVDIWEAHQIVGCQESIPQRKQTPKLRNTSWQVEKSANLSFQLGLHEGYINLYSLYMI